MKSIWSYTEAISGNKMKGACKKKLLTKGKIGLIKGALGSKLALFGAQKRAEGLLLVAIENILIGANSAIYCDWGAPCLCVTPRLNL